MNLKTILALAALAAAGVNASAATTTVTDWHTLGPIASVAIVNYPGGYGDINDIYTFDIAATSDVDGYGEEFEARSVSMPGATFTLFSGLYGSADVTQVGAAMPFTNTPSETVYMNLASGNYYFQVQGTVALGGASYDFEAFADNSSPPSTVPEPANAALLLAGVGMMAFLGTRRRHH
ncbi:MAG: FxDxF family PEP-CTERM protein [Betaproteobacteria bacterium]